MNTGIYNKIKKFTKVSIISIILFIASILLSTSVNAVANWRGSLTSGMPSFVSNGVTGYLPQIVVNAGMVFCNDQDSMIRNGSKDFNKYYPSADDYINGGAPSTYVYGSAYDGRIEERARNRAIEEFNSEYDSIDVSASYSLGNIDGGRALMVIVAGDSIHAFETRTQIAEQSAVNNLKRINGQLAKESKAPKLLENYDAIEHDFQEYSGADPYNGPQVAVMGSGTNSNYTATGGSGLIDTRSTSSFDDIMNAYIYTGLYHVSRENQTQYSLLDIQTASWLQNDHKGNRHGFNADGSGYTTLSQGTARGMELYNEAKQYYKFTQELKANGGYKAIVNTNNAQVFVSRVDSNRSADQLIIGPVSITYPYYKNISYMTDILVDANSTDNGNVTLSYNNGDFSIITYGSGSSYLTGGQTFPLNGENFYIVLNASSANYPEEISIRGQFEYTSYARTQYYELQAVPHIYSYRGHIEQGSITFTYTFHYHTMENRPTGATYTVNVCNICGTENRDGEPSCYHYNYRIVTRQEQVPTRVEHEEKKDISVTLVQAYVQMDTSTYVTDVGQDLRSIVGMQSSVDINIDFTQEQGYTTFAKKDRAEASAKIDLRIKLGGKVWVDGTAGKESKYDGQFINSTDTPMSGVKVVLHQRKPNGSESVKAETKTDTNGNYTFENLNALYTYYVEFVYNGQYYQPTIYKAEGTSWANSSKGVDIISERQSFNAKFAEIGSNPQNYKGGEVYTRAKLEEMGAIDKFGNPTGNNQYVNDCMMSSYTGYNQNGSFHREYYPVYNKFVISDSINGANRASIARDSNGQSISTYSMLYNGEYNNLHINQGYVLREEVDLAIKKDVYTATLEINGKTQTYNYNKRQLNEDGAWEISTRISDGYYNANYSRELYREDYEYNVDTYKTNGIDVSKEKELKVYVTYKFTVRNQSEVLAGRVTEIVDYYDQEYTFIPGRTYLGDKNGNKLGDITGSEHSIYGTATESKFAGYRNVYLTGMENVLLDPDMNKDLYVYVTFMVNKDNGNIILDEQLSDGTPIGVGKENIAEINGYKSYYGSRAHAPNENNPKTTTEYTGSKYDENGNLVKEGDVAGKTDKDSVPGNLNPDDVVKDGNVNYDKFEDDTDKAPNIRIILNRDNIRTIDGTVWEDERTITEANAQVGDGIRQENEIGVNGVRVQLVEILENGQEYIWKEVNSGDTIAQTLIIDNTDIATKPNGENVVHSYNIEKDGQYKFVSFAPGNYIVRFIYGDGTSTVLGTKSTDYYTGDTIDNPVTDLVNTLNGYNKTIQDQGYNSAIENIGLNEKSYNGQDYKSTTYQYNANNSTGVNNGTSAYEATESKTYSYNFAAADEQLYSDAKDIMSRRQVVNSYSTSDITNHKAEVLASFERIPTYNEMPYDAQQIADLLNEFIPNTYMIAETGTIDVNFEYNRTGSGTSSSGNSNIGTSNYDMSGYYNITNLDLGLEQRPQAQLKVSKQITNVKVKLANGSTLFDASSRATNVLWSDHIAHGLDTKNTYTTSNNYENSMMKTPVVRQNSKDKGLIQLTMDEELMHGATIQITYAITVANVGEVDYNENQFYYTGKVANTSTIVKTIPNVLIDYVGFQAESGNATRNNLQFIAEQNPDWSIISTDDLLIDGLLNINLTENANSYTTIVKTDSVSKALKPIIADEDKAKEIDNAFKNDPLNALNTVNSSESVVGVQLVLSQMITSDNKTDDMTYNNLVELVKTSNEAGRRMAYSVVGNQDPKLEPQEIDADNSQEVTILPPFGQNYIYYVLGGAIAIILIAGIVFTIRVVRKRR